MGDTPSIFANESEEIFFCSLNCLSLFKVITSRYVS
nr:MAG TPA: hypothetical protein [Caudoviricetes sp.]